MWGDGCPSSYFDCQNRNTLIVKTKILPLSKHLSTPAIHQSAWTNTLISKTNTSIFSDKFLVNNENSSTTYAVFVCLYFCICTLDTWKHHFWYPWTNLFSKIYHMLCLSGTLWYAVFAYLFICFCAFYTCIIFDSPEKSSFQKYTTCLGFLALGHVLYLCNCVFVYLYLCICE